jgi:hypothetical protein
MSPARRRCWDEWGGLKGLDWDEVEMGAATDRRMGDRWRRGGAGIGRWRMGGAVMSGSLGQEHSTVRRCTRCEHCGIVAKRSATVAQAVHHEQSIQLNEVYNAIQSIQLLR